MSIDWTLYLVTDPDLAGGRDNVVSIVQEAVRGGVTVVQLRDKEASDEQIERTAREALEAFELPILSSQTCQRQSYVRDIGSGQSVMDLPADNKARLEIEAVTAELLELLQ